MEYLINFFLKHDRATLLLLFIIFFLGIFAYIKIPKESNPDIQIPIILVSTTLQGISAEDSERLLVKPLESGLRSVNNVKEMRSTATEGRAYIVLEFNAGFDNKKALQDVRAKVEDILGKLPAEADRPAVKEINISLLPIITLSLSGSLPERELISIGKTFKKRIEGLPNILSVEVAGSRKEILEVLIEPATLSNYNLDLAQIGNALHAYDTLITAGSIKASNYSVKLKSSIETLEDVKSLPIKASGNSILYLQDVAEIRSSLEEAQSTATVNGNPAIVLEISKKSGKHIIETVSQVKTLVKELQMYLPENLVINYSSDQSRNVTEMLNDLENNIIFATILVILIIILSMGLRPAMLIALSIPGSFFIGILFIFYLGYTVNIVVLFSLILSVGMLVDAAIVVEEYADRRMISGTSPKEAYQSAALMMFWPVLSSTLTTIVVFMPLLFWPGMAGKFMQYLPITLITTLTGSLLMSIIFLPTLGSLFGTNPSTYSSSEILRLQAIDAGDIQAFGPLTTQYYKLLIKILNKPLLFVSGTCLTLLVSALLYASFGKGIEFFPKVEPENIVIKISSPGNFSLAEKTNILKTAESLLEPLKNNFAMVYTRAGHFRDNSEGKADLLGKIQIELEDWKVRERSFIILEKIKQQLVHLEGVKVEVEEAQQGPSQGKPIKINLSTKSSTILNKVGQALLEYLNSVEGLTNIEDSKGNPEIEWDIKVDRDKAAILGVSTSVIGEYLKLITNGVILAKYKPNYADEEIDIVVRFPNKYRNISQLESYLINSSSGPILAKDLISWHPVRKTHQINRVNSLRTLTISADVNRGVLVNTKLKEIKKWIYENRAQYPGIEISFKGEEAEQKETGTFLMQAFVLALLFIALVLVLQFNSYYETFIIMTAIFLSTTGVLLGLLITNQAFGIVMCGVGIIALAGIVVNNNILLIDGYKVNKELGLTSKEAIIRAAISRLRPIFLTAGTTVLGLIPMISRLNIDFVARAITYNSPSSQWWVQLATTIAGGLTFSTILTLLFTPALLMLRAHKSENNASN